MFLRAAGNWLFHGRRWLNPLDPADRALLDSNYAALARAFPHFAASCDRPRFLEVLADIATDWNCIVHGHGSAEHSTRWSTGPRRRGRQAVPSRASGPAWPEAVDPPAAALDVLLSALKSAAAAAAGSVAPFGAAPIAASVSAVGQNGLGMPLPPVQPLTDFRLCNTAEAAAALVAEQGAALGRDVPAPTCPRCRPAQTSAVVRRSAVSGSSFLPVEESLTAAVAAAKAGSSASTSAPIPAGEVDLFEGCSVSPARWPLRIPAKAAGAAVDFALGGRPVMFPCRSCSAVGSVHFSSGSLALGEPGPGGVSAFAPVASSRPRGRLGALQVPPLQNGSGSVALPTLLLPQF